MPDTCVVICDRSAVVADPSFNTDGALPLAVVLDQRTVLLCGWMSAPLPATAEVALGNDEPRGTW